MTLRPNDTFAGAGRLLRLDDALELLSARARVATGIERVPLKQAPGRILASHVVAGRNVPPHDNSAVDGYAVRFADLARGAPTRLSLAGRVAAGQVFDGALPKGAALRIFTGAPVPAGADTVVMQEECSADATHVTVPAGVERGANHRKAGEDIVAGASVLQAGRRIRAPDIGLAASLGLATLEVRTKLRVALFSTGNEVREPGTDAPAGAIYDSNRYTLHALLEQLGCAVDDLGIVPDRRDTLRDLLQDAARSNDLIVSSGGVSVGDEDYVRTAVAELGALHVWRLAIKPGKPIAFGQVGAVPFIGLPGNPVAVMVTFLRVARPFILALAGATDVAPMLYRAIADFDYAKKLGRREWLRARVTRQVDGLPIAHLYPRRGSAILSSVVESDGLIELPEDMAELKRGTAVDFLPFTEVD